MWPTVTLAEYGPSNEHQEPMEAKIDFTGALDFIVADCRIVHMADLASCEPAWICGAAETQVSSFRLQWLWSERGGGTS